MAKNNNSNIITDKDIKWPYQSKNWSGPKTVNTPEKYRKWKKAYAKLSSPAMAKGKGLDF